MPSASPLTIRRLAGTLAPLVALGSFLISVPSTPASAAATPQSWCTVQGGDITAAPTKRNGRAVASATAICDRAVANLTVKMTLYRPIGRGRQVLATSTVSRAGVSQLPAVVSTPCTGTTSVTYQARTDVTWKDSQGTVYSDYWSSFGAKLACF